MKKLLTITILVLLLVLSTTAVVSAQPPGPPPPSGQTWYLDSEDHAVPMAHNMEREAGAQSGTVIAMAGIVNWDEAMDHVGEVAKVVGPVVKVDAFGADQILSIGIPGPAGPPAFTVQCSGIDCGIVVGQEIAATGTINLFGPFMNPTIVITDCGDIQTEGVCCGYWKDPDPGECDPGVAIAPGLWPISLNTADWTADFDVKIGYSDPDYCQFYPWASQNLDVVMYDGGKIEAMVSTSSCEMVPLGHHLAMRVYNSGVADQIIVTDGSSTMSSPESDPGYPLPEIGAGILMALGLGGLGFYAYMRRKVYQS
jgi:hypothetical protein